jgi:K+-transporting ATPase ATPase C chain
MLIKALRPALAHVLALTLLTGLVLPLALTGLAQGLFPEAARGSLIVQGDRIIGSRLIGQAFSAPGYFHPRPSATTEPDPKDPSKQIPTPYAADNSGGSSLAPTSKALLDRVRSDVAELRAESPAPIPADAVTTSGSGLDPDISPAYAYRQVPRIARARHLDEAKLRALVAAHLHRPLLGFIGEPRVNVLELNLALDAAAAR